MHVVARACVHLYAIIGLSRWTPTTDDRRKLKKKKPEKSVRCLHLVIFGAGDDHSSLGGKSYSNALCVRVRVVRVGSRWEEGHSTRNKKTNTKKTSRPGGSHNAFFFLSKVSRQMKPLREPDDGTVYVVATCLTCSKLSACRTTRAVAVTTLLLFSSSSSTCNNPPPVFRPRVVHADVFVLFHRERSAFS